MFALAGWFREHVLQHHMYTNTPWDNHFRGTDPFLKTDPTVERHWIQARIMPYINPLILTFGLYGNYVAHLTDMLSGHEEWRRPTKAILPLNILLIVCKWGVLHGALLTYTWSAVLGLWYFTMALMNHNSEHSMDVDARNKARDWGEQQLISSADWCVALPFHHAWIFVRLGRRRTRPPEPAKARHSPPDLPPPPSAHPRRPASLSRLRSIAPPSSALAFRSCGSTTTPCTTSSRGSTCRTTQPRSRSSCRRAPSLVSSMSPPIRR